MPELDAQKLELYARQADWDLSSQHFRSSGEDWFRVGTASIVRNGLRFVSMVYIEPNTDPEVAERSARENLAAIVLGYDMSPNRSRYAGICEVVNA